MEEDRYPGPQADARRAPSLLREAEEPGRGRKQVEFELGLIELRESREEREHEVRERGRMTVGGEPGGEAQHAAAACRHTFL